MKILKTLLVAILIGSLASTPLSAAWTDFIPIPSMTTVATTAFKTTAAAASFTKTHPRLAPVLFVAGTTGTAIYGYLLVTRIVKTTVTTFIPLAAIPLLNQRAARDAVTTDNAGMFDYALSMSMLMKNVPFLDRVPYVGKNLGLDLPGDALHSAIREQRFGVADVMIQRCGEANIDINRYIGNQTPLSASLATQYADETSQLLIQQRADLALAGRVGKQSAFQDVVATGKRQLIQSALARPDYLQFVDTINDVHANTLAHLCAVSRGLRALVVQTGHLPTRDSFGRTNAAGRLPLDIITVSFTDLTASGAEVADVVRATPTAAFASTNRNDLFGSALQDNDMRAAGIPRLLFDNGAVKTAFADRRGRTPLSHTVASTDAKLAEDMATATDASMINNIDIATAELHNLKTAAQILMAKRVSLTGKRQTMADVYSSPYDDSRSLLRLMAQNDYPFDEANFRGVFAFLKSHFGSARNFLVEEQLLDVALRAGNVDAANLIWKLMKDEGLGNQGRILADARVLPMIAYYNPSAIGPVLQDLKRDAPRMLTRMVEDSVEAGFIGKVSDSTPLLPGPLAMAALPAPDAPASADVSMIPVSSASQLLVIGSDRYQLVPAKVREFVRDEKYNAAQMAELHEARKERFEKKAYHQDIKTQEEDRSGVPDTIVLRNIERRPHVPVPLIKKLAAYNGYLGTNAIKHRGALNYFMIVRGIKAPEAMEDNFKSSWQNELAWAIAHSMASLSMAYGTNPNPGAGVFARSNVGNAAMNTAVYGINRLWTGPGYIAQNQVPVDPDSQGVRDFTSRYGLNIATDMAFTSAESYMIARITQASFGLPGVIVPAVMTLGTDLLVYYHVYTYDPDHEVRSSAMSEAMPHAVAGTAFFLYLAMLTTTYRGTSGWLTTGYHAIQALVSAIVLYSWTHQISSLIGETTKKAFTWR